MGLVILEFLTLWKNYSYSSL